MIRKFESSKWKFISLFLTLKRTYVSKFQISDLLSFFQKSGDRLKSNKSARLTRTIDEYKDRLQNCESFAFVDSARFYHRTEPGGNLEEA